VRRLHITVSRRFLDKLAAARDALSHTLPEAGTEAVLEAALDLLEKSDRRKGLVKGGMDGSVPVAAERWRRRSVSSGDVRHDVAHRTECFRALPAVATEDARSVGYAEIARPSNRG